MLMTPTSQTLDEEILYLKQSLGYTIETLASDTTTQTLWVQTPSNSLVVRLVENVVQEYQILEGDSQSHVYPLHQKLSEFFKTKNT